jgi:ABC-type molybdate transport system ATPase subunit
MVAIGRALMTTPDLILLAEPDIKRLYLGG